jgi:hypothetical protein
MPVVAFLLVCNGALMTDHPSISETATVAADSAAIQAFYAAARHEEGPVPAAASGCDVIRRALLLHVVDYGNVWLTHCV